MARVRCTEIGVSPGDEVNGFRFDGERGALVSVEMTDEQAADLVQVPGYELVRETAPAAAPAPLPGDTNGDGKLSAAEKRAAAKKPAAPPSRG